MQAVMAVGILLVVIVLLVSGRVRIDLVGVVALSLVGVFGLIPTGQLFSGFSSYAAIILAEMFVLGEGLRRSGATEIMAQWFERLGRRGEAPLLTALLTLPPIPSTFVSDVGLMSILLPTMVRMGQRLKLSLHRLLMPLAFAIALGGLLSMVGSAGNIIGNAALASKHYHPIPLFGITPLGAILVAAGFIFMRWWGVRLLPDQNSGGDAEFFSNYHEVKSYLSELWVGDESPVIGHVLQDVPYLRTHSLTVLRIIREGHPPMVPGGRVKLQAGDRLVVQGDVSAIVDMTPEDGFELTGDSTAVRLRSEHVRVVEAMVPQRSRLVNHSLRDINFRVRYGPTVLAILRQGVTRVRELPRIPIQAGDILLVMGTPESISRLQNSDDLLVFADVEQAAPALPHKSLIAVAVVVGVLLMAAFNFLAIQVAAAVGIGILVGTGILSLDHAYRAVDWRIIMLVGGVTPLSLALTRTGVTAGLAHFLLHAVGSFGPYAVLAIFFGLAALLTQVISNVAAALVLSPLAISMASANHWSPDALIIAMIVALSAAPLTPLANKVFIMAMGPGRYRYQDFLKIGIPLSAIMWVLTVLIAPVLFPLVR
jgi:di/tricarboxylate transporter